MEILTLGSKGTRVKEIQSLLKRIGYSITVDGDYGSKTATAIKKFQTNNGLTPDGVIGDKTNKLLENLLLGYDKYTIKKGDTLSNIAKKYYTSAYSIIIANPGIQPYSLKIGQTITVPYGLDVVDTNIDYTYSIMERNILGLKARYPFLTTGSIGKSVLSKNLYYIKLGTGSNNVFFNASHHALEWITSPLMMKFIENFLKAYVLKTTIRGYDISDIWRESSIYIVPMVNPDGVDLVLNGLRKSNPYYTDLIKWNNGSSDFSTNWEANTKGVDLNHNYNASWEISKKAEALYGVSGPGPTRFGGLFPESEPETKAMVNFTKSKTFRLTLSYHSQGEVIYYQYGSLTPPESRRIAELFSKVSGYALSETTGIASYAGYKDWFIEYFSRPGFTIEVGKGKNPIPISQFSQIYNDNEELLILASII